MTLPPAVHAALRDFDHLLQEHASRLGLIAEADRDRIWERHVLDSLRALPCLPSGTIEVVDIGSGAGLPGIPLAIARPAARFVLLEPKRRRAGFLELAVERLRLRNVTVVTGRAEPAGPEPVERGHADACTLRAVAPSVEAWRLADPFLRPGGIAVYFAGRSWGTPDERALAATAVDARVCAGPSLDGGGPVVIMGRRPPVTSRQPPS